MQRILHALIFFIVVLYSSYVYLYFYQTGAISFKPLYWHFLTIVYALVLIILRMPSFLDGTHRLFIFWIWAFVCNSIVCFLYSPQGNLEVEALYESIRVSVLILSFCIILQGDSAIRLSRLAFLIVLLFSVAMNIVDFTMPMWSKVPGRAAGLFVNPTIAGKMLVLMMVVGLPLVPRKIRLAYCALVGVGVLVTFSRGPWFLWLIAIIGLSVSGHLESSRKAMSIIIVSFLSGFVVYNALTGGFLDILTATGLDEYLTRGTLARLGDNGTAFSDNSTVSRAAAAAKAWAVFSEYPLFGAGLGHDQGWTVGAHNTYLRFAAEGGIFRLGIFIGLLVVLWYIADSIGRITLVVYAASSMVSHNNLEAPPLLLILALIVASSRIKNSDNHIGPYDSKLLPIK
ncbi:MAG: O-antigen ligase family protein [Gammaproteobacteria bacterium]|nr:O-antigen ligase family protein [Gammaproteobacteria bacterium]